MQNLFCLIWLICLSFTATAQHGAQYNLAQYFRENKLAPSSTEQIKITHTGDTNAVSITGLVWIRGITFQQGAIDIDLRGRDVFQQSFIGVVFHGSDTSSYECLYFRPFNFHSPDTLRQKHTVQYMSLPANPWYVLRKDHPLIYENAVTPVPDPAAWFHATILVRNDSVMVFVNHGKTPCLVIRELPHSSAGRIGLWNDGLRGDFANLELTQ